MGFLRLCLYLFCLPVFLPACAVLTQLPQRALADTGGHEAPGKVPAVMSSSRGYLDIGVASWYGTKFHGRPTSMGETYDMHGMTAAHRELPLPTMVEVTNLDNGRKLVVRVNDRGPFHEDRLIDLSFAAAKALGFEHHGTAPVVVKALDKLNYPAVTAPQGPSIYFQVGAYSTLEGASGRLGEVMDLLAGRARSRILEIEGERGMLYRVWIGPFTDAAEGERVAALIAAELGELLRIVVK